MSFSCAHFVSKESWCKLLKVACDPGRPGCILKGKVVFAKNDEARPNSDRRPDSGNLNRPNPLKALKTAKKGDSNGEH